MTIAQLTQLHAHKQAIKVAMQQDEATIWPRAWMEYALESAGNQTPSQTWLQLHTAGSIVQAAHDQQLYRLTY